MFLWRSKESHTGAKIHFLLRLLISHKGTVWTLNFDWLGCLKMDYFFRSCNYVWSKKRKTEVKISLMLTSQARIICLSIYIPRYLFSISLHFIGMCARNCYSSFFLFLGFNNTPISFLVKIHIRSVKSCRQNTTATYSSFDEIKI